MSELLSERVSQRGGVCVVCVVVLRCLPAGLFACLSISQFAVVGLCFLCSWMFAAAGGVDGRERFDRADVETWKAVQSDHREVMSISKNGVRRCGCVL